MSPLGGQPLIALAGWRDKPHFFVSRHTTDFSSKKCMAHVNNGYKKQFLESLQ
jgi:hypothetical protein